MSAVLPLTKVQEVTGPVLRRHLLAVGPGVTIAQVSERDRSCQLGPALAKAANGVWAELCSQETLQVLSPPSDQGADDYHNDVRPWDWKRKI